MTTWNPCVVLAHGWAIEGRHDTHYDSNRRIARELHDSAGQILTALGMSLGDGRSICPQQCSPVCQVHRGERQTGQATRVRKYAACLMCCIRHCSTKLAWRSALRWYIQGLTKRSGLGITLEVPPDFERLPR